MNRIISEELFKKAISIMATYASSNPKWTYQDVEQDPSGVHATLEQLRNAPLATTLDLTGIDSVVDQWVSAFCVEESTRNYGRGLFFTENCIPDLKKMLSDLATLQNAGQVGGEVVEPTTRDYEQGFKQKYADYPASQFVFQVEKDLGGKLKQKYMFMVTGFYVGWMTALRTTQLPTVPQPHNAGQVGHDDIPDDQLIGILTARWKLKRDFRDFAGPFIGAMNAGQVGEFDYQAFINGVEAFDWCNSDILRDIKSAMGTAKWVSSTTQLPTVPQPGPDRPVVVSEIQMFLHDAIDRNVPESLKEAGHAMVDALQPVHGVPSVDPVVVESFVYDFARENGDESDDGMWIEERQFHEFARLLTALLNLQEGR